MVIFDVLNNNETKPFSWKLIVEVWMKETDLVSSDENGDGELYSSPTLLSRLVGYTPDNMTRDDVTT